MKYVVVIKTMTLLGVIYNKLGKRGKIAESFSIIYFYRYASWAVTSLFYLMGEPRGPLGFKLGVVISLLFAAEITMNLQLKLYKNAKALTAMVLAETLGITLLLIPIGGLNSSFIWYAMNPVFVAASFLSPYVVFLNLNTYLESMSKLNGIHIDIRIKGDEHLLSYKAKKAFYRIISEATGNAIRHGKADRLEVTLESYQDKSILFI